MYIILGIYHSKDLLVRGEKQERKNSIITINSIINNNMKFEDPTLNIYKISV